MGHCVHFLSRLERVSMEHADVALELYRNPRLVRTLMEEFAGIYQDDRAALALGKDGAGPYIVVAVDGGFVTCLGENMKPRGLQVIKRELLESRRTLSEEYPVAMQRFLQLTRQGETTRLLERIFSNGQLVCREDVEQAQALLPVFQLKFIEHILWMSRTLSESRDRLLRVVSRMRTKRGKIAKLKRMAAKVAAYHWVGAWSIVTCHAIVAAGGVRSLQSMHFPESDQLGPAFMVSFVEGHGGIALRNLWAVGVRGVAVVTIYETILHELESSDYMVGNVASLTIAALRHPELREQVGRHLREIRRDHGDSKDVVGAVECAHEVLSLDLQELEEQYGMVVCGEHLSLGRRIYERIRRGLLPDHPDYYEDLDEVPQSLLCTLGLMMPGHYLSDGDVMRAMFYCLPWLSQAEFGDLFLPRSLNDRLQVVGPSDGEQGLELLSWQAPPVEEENVSPYVSTQKAGRNDPCPCRSGRKYKQCCLNGSQQVSADRTEMMVPGLF